MGKGHRPEREPVVGALELDPVRTADDEAQIAPRHAALLQEARKGHGALLLAVGSQQRHVGVGGNAPRRTLLLAHLEELQSGMS